MHHGAFPTATIIFVAYLSSSQRSTYCFSLPKATVFRPRLKRTLACCISPYTGMRTHPSTPTIPPEVIPRRERVEDSACVYLPVLVFPLVLDLPELSGCHTAFMSHNTLFPLISSVNIPWSRGGKGDGDYLYAFEKVVMPIAREFAPEIVLGMRPPPHIAHSLIHLRSVCRVRCCRGRSAGRMQRHPAWIFPDDK